MYIYIWKRKSTVSDLLDISTNPCICFKHFTKEIHLGKGENAGNQHFLLFPNCFLSRQRHISLSEKEINLSSANPFNMDRCKTLLIVLRVKAFGDITLVFHCYPVKNI